MYNIFWSKKNMIMCRCLVLSGICFLLSAKQCVGNKLARGANLSAIRGCCTVTVQMQEAMLSSMSLVRFRHQTQHSSTLGYS